MLVGRDLQERALRLLIRWVSNCVAIFLALYLLDSLSSGRFHIKAWWVALVAGILLGLVNSLVRPRGSLRVKPLRLLVWITAVFLVNALAIQILVWAGGALEASSLLWVLLAAVVVAAISRLITWLIGFDQKGTATREPLSTSGRKPTPTDRSSRTASAPRRRP